MRQENLSDLLKNLLLNGQSNLTPGLLTLHFLGESICSDISQ